MDPRTADMPVIRLETWIAAPRETVFDLAIDVGVHMASAAQTHERAVAGVTRGPLHLGESVTWQARHLGRSWRLTAAITAYDRPNSFTDELVDGPLASMDHRHRFLALDGGTLMVETFEYSLPWRSLARIAEALVVTPHLTSFLLRRNRHIKNCAERAGPEPRNRILRQRPGGRNQEDPSMCKSRITQGQIM